MFIPFKDHNPLILIRVPVVNLSIIAVNVVVFIVSGSGWIIDAASQMPYRYGVIPAVLFDYVELGEQLAVIPESFTFATYMFVHGGWIHLLSNMLFLYVLGDNLEDALGHLRYILFYLLCGIAAAAAHIAIMPQSQAPLIGASGAVAGVIGGYMLLFPRVRIWILLLGRIPLPIPAGFAFGFWIALQVFNVVFGFEKTVAWWAHIGGFVAGIMLTALLRKRAFPLLGSR